MSFRKFMEDNQLTNTTVAHWLGVTAQQAYMYKRNDRIPTERLRELKDILSLPPDRRTAYLRDKKRWKKDRVFRMPRFSNERDALHYCAKQMVKAREELSPPEKKVSALYEALCRKYGVNPAFPKTILEQYAPLHE